jgi:hypothetical protein
MGRGRQRAKDAKIARQLKYANNGSDLRALERELVSGHSDVIPAAAPNDLEPDIDPIGEWDEDVDEVWSDDADER